MKVFHALVNIKARNGTHKFYAQKYHLVIQSALPFRLHNLWPYVSCGIYCPNVIKTLEFFILFTVFESEKTQKLLLISITEACQQARMNVQNMSSQCLHAMH